MYNLLVEPLIRVTTLGGDRLDTTLPGVFHLASNDAIEALDALRPHQHQSWHCFLVQLGALAVLRSDPDAQDLPEDEASWRNALKALTTEWGEDEPWQLVQEDWSRPAFMQPPVPAGQENTFNKIISEPDKLDVVLSAKNHDVKTGMVTNGRADDWLYALVSLQTMGGFLGVGNYGIARMNGGFSSRLMIGLAPVGGTGAHVMRDIRLLVSLRSEIAKDYRATYPAGNAGKALLWLDSWDGVAAVGVDELDPYFIEVCRRLRLMRGSSNALEARTASSKSQRIAAKALNGNLGDPWAPIDISAGKSLSVDKHCFEYRRLSSILFDTEQYRLPIAMTLMSDERAQDMELVARVLARGRGKTEGLHYRRIPLRPAARRAMGRAPDAQLADISRERVEDAGFIAKALRDALAVLLSGAPGYDTGRVDFNKILKSHNSAAQTMANSLHEYVDSQFYEDLWREFEADSESRSAIRRQWIRATSDHGLGILEGAGLSVPCKSALRRRARVAAVQVYRGRLASQFPDIRSDQQEQRDV